MASNLINQQTAKQPLAFLTTSSCSTLVCLLADLFLFLLNPSLTFAQAGLLFGLSFPHFALGRLFWGFGNRRARG
jgi:hypothetical protein